VLVRDYGLYDHAMLRFTPGHKLADSFYVRQDGTRAYYFSTGKYRLALQVLLKIFVNAVVSQHHFYAFIRVTHSLIFIYYYYYSYANRTKKHKIKHTD